MKTLQDVVQAVVDELVAGDETFSAHEVTQAARSYVNRSTENFKIPAGNDRDGNWVEHFIDHQDVRRMVVDIFNTGVLDRVFTGTYFEYSPVRQISGVSPTNDLADRIHGYLSNRYIQNANGREIQGAVCRSGSQDKPMVPVADIIDVALRDHRFKVYNKADAPSYAVVELVDE
jgi:hypothetical protein